MKLRFSATTIVALALMLGQSTTVLVAGLCSHLRSNQSSCNNQSVETQVSHHDMDHMQMEPDVLPVSSSLTEQVEAVRSTQSCSHCAIHSRTNGSTESLKQFYVANRSHDGTFAVSQSLDKSIFVSETLKLPSRAHGPPGSTSARHVLISVFRI